MTHIQVVRSLEAVEQQGWSFVDRRDYGLGPDHVAVWLARRGGSWAVFVRKFAYDGYEARYLGRVSEKRAREYMESIFEDARLQQSYAIRGEYPSINELHDMGW